MRPSAGRPGLQWYPFNKGYRKKRINRESGGEGIRIFSGLFVLPACGSAAGWGEFQGNKKKQIYNEEFDPGSG